MKSSHTSHSSIETQSLQRYFSHVEQKFRWGPSRSPNSPDASLPSALPQPQLGRILPTSDVVLCAGVGVFSFVGTFVSQAAAQRVGGEAAAAVGQAAAAAAEAAAAEKARRRAGKDDEGAEDGDDDDGESGGGGGGSVVASCRSTATATAAGTQDHALGARQQARVQVAAVRLLTFGNQLAVVLAFAASLVLRFAVFGE